MPQAVARLKEAGVTILRGPLEVEGEEGAELAAPFGVELIKANLFRR